MDIYDRNYQLYSEAFNQAKTEEERLELLHGLGISNIRRNNDWVNYLHLLTDHNPKGTLEQMTDFELLDQLPINLRRQADNFITRREMIDFVRNNRRKAGKLPGRVVTPPRPGISTPTTRRAADVPLPKTVTPPRAKITPPIIRRGAITPAPRTKKAVTHPKARISPPIIRRAAGTPAPKKVVPNVSYERCIEDATDRKSRGKLKLCPAGYCTAKEKFDVYPSLYSNAYAVQVCKGTKPDYYGNFYDHYSAAGEVKPEDSDMERWFKEKWVNVCEPGMPECGRKKGSLNPKDYPYCRPLNKLPGTSVKTVNELSKRDINEMCRRKRAFRTTPKKVFVKDLPVRR
jgi:hypothetical protein